MKTLFMKKELLFRLYGSPSFRAFLQTIHWQNGLGVGVAPPEPIIVKFISSPSFKLFISLVLLSKYISPLPRECLELTFSQEQDI